MRTLLHTIAGCMFATPIVYALVFHTSREELKGLGIFLGVLALIIGGLYLTVKADNLKKRDNDEN